MSERHVALDGPLGMLRGMLHLPEGEGPFPGVVLLHGFTGHHIENKRLFVQAARHFAAAGFAALRVSFFGSGDSDGAFEEMTVHTELADAAAMLRWLGDQPVVDRERIAVLGLSLGGAVAALLAGQESGVAGVVFWNAVALPSLHFTDIARSGPDAGAVDGLCVSEDFLSTFYALDIAGALAGYAGPGLVVRGTNDAVVLGKEAEMLANALGARGTLHLIPGADHTFMHVDWRADLFARTTGWLQEHLSAQ